jgi:stage IV sporulation protein FB
VLLQNPPPTAYDLCFSVFGIPVRVHPFFWLISMVMGMSGGGNNEPAAVMIWVVAVFFSILIHELGHALVARAFGWPPRITLYGMGGMASYSPTYHDTKRQIAISAAGPGAGFLFAGLVIGLLFARAYVAIKWGQGVNEEGVFGFSNPRLEMLISDLLWINIGWGVINLLPILPLDGGHIADEVLATLFPAQGHRYALVLSTFAGGAVAVLGLVYLRSVFMGLMFGYLAYQSYLAWQGRYRRGRF